MANEPKPHWWSALQDTSWEKMRSSIVADWQKLKERSTTAAHSLSKDVQERALSFGHGAKGAYAKLGAWSADVEQKLKADWEQTHKDATQTWDKVRDAVKHGWEKTVDSK